MRGVIFRGLPPQEQWEGGGETGGRRPGPGWRWRRPVSSAPGLGVSPGHRAESRGALARENRGQLWRGPGRKQGRGPSPPGWDPEGAEGSPLPLPAACPRPPSSAEAQAGAGRGPTWGSGGGPPGPGGLAGLSPLPSSPPRGDETPPDARLRRLRRFSAVRLSPLPLLVLPPGAVGIAASSGEPAGAGRGGETGCGGRAGEGLSAVGGSERAGERANGAFLRSSGAPRARPGGRRTHGPRTDSARKPRCRRQVSRPRRPPPGPEDPAASQLVCVRARVCGGGDHGGLQARSPVLER